MTQRIDYILNTFSREQLESTEMSEGEPLSTIMAKAKQRVEAGLADRAEVVDSNNYVVFRWPRAAHST